MCLVTKTVKHKTLKKSVNNSPTFEIGYTDINQMINIIDTENTRIAKYIFS